MHEASGHDRALIPSVGSHRLPLFEEQEGRQRTARLDAIGRDQLWNIEGMDGRKAGIFGVRRIDPCKRGIGGSEVDADLHEGIRKCIIMVTSAIWSIMPLYARDE